jgi:hypothetical protein
MVVTEPVKLTGELKEKTQKKSGDYETQAVDPLAKSLFLAYLAWMVLARRSTTHWQRIESWCLSEQDCLLGYGVQEGPFSRIYRAWSKKIVRLWFLDCRCVRIGLTIVSQRTR